LVPGQYRAGRLGDFLQVVLEVSREAASTGQSAFKGLLFNQLYVLFILQAIVLDPLRSGITEGSFLDTCLCSRLANRQLLIGSKGHQFSRPGSIVDLDFHRGCRGEKLSGRTSGGNSRSSLGNLRSKNGCADPKRVLTSLAW